MTIATEKVTSKFNENSVVANLIPKWYTINDSWDILWIILKSVVSKIGGGANRLCLPSCGPGFESQAHHIRFYSQILYFIRRFVEKRTKINKKWPGSGHIFLKKSVESYNIKPLVYYSVH